ncbi:MAG: IS1380 family transposase, partial [Candidatus Dormibacteraeota bacterium]|nr:IS1380 family transposase [Candidatus Dormibacteraeota bacterium]
MELEADRRRHAKVAAVIRDLKEGAGLAHLPSGRFAANAAWLAFSTMAHNLARWVVDIGLPEQLPAR